MFFWLLLFLVWMVSPLFVVLIIILVLAVIEMLIPPKDWSKDD